VDLWRELGDRHSLASVLHRLGDTLHSAGKSDQAREAWLEAQAIHEQVHHPEAAEVSAKLAR
jgi:hypothetical protein